MPAPVHDQQALKACNEDIAGKQAPSLASRSRGDGCVPAHTSARARKTCPRSGWVAENPTPRVGDA
jgi:hypothetical protein